MADNRFLPKLSQNLLEILNDEEYYDILLLKSGLKIEIKFYQSKIQKENILPDFFRNLLKFCRITIQNIKLFTGDFSKIPDFAGIYNTVFSPVLDRMDRSMYKREMRFFNCVMDKPTRNDQVTNRYISSSSVSQLCCNKLPFQHNGSFGIATFWAINKMNMAFIHVADITRHDGFLTYK